MPLSLYAFSSNPQIPWSGAPTDNGTCASCHGSLATPSLITLNAPTTYTPGGTAVSMTATIPSNGGWELSARLASNDGQAGVLAAGTGSNVATATTSAGTIQFVRSSSSGTSWTFTWTPPATNVGNIVLYTTGGNHGTNYASSFTLTPAAGTTPETLTLSATTLSFTFDGTATPATQAVQVTSSGAPIPVTVTSVVTSPAGGTWLTATPPGGNTPVGVTVAVNPAGLAVGTYTGTVSVASTGATNSPQTVAVTFTLTAPGPVAQPTLVATPSSLTFTVTAGGAAPPAQSVQVSASDNSTQAFTAAAATKSNGNWLAVTPASGNTPGTESVTVDPTGLAAGTYSGTVTLTSAGVSNSPLLVNVTFTVNSTTPPPTQTVNFSFNVTDQESGGTDSLLLDGTGTIDTSGKVTASGSFTQSTTPPGCPAPTGGDEVFKRHAIVASGTWTATSATVNVTGTGRRTSGTIVLMVSLSPQGGAMETGTMTIASTGTNRGVTLAIDGGATFMPTGVGRVSITASGSGGGGGSGDDAVTRR